MGLGELEMATKANKGAGSVFNRGGGSRPRQATSNRIRLKLVRRRAPRKSRPAGRKSRTGTRRR